VAAVGRQKAGGRRQGAGGRRQGAGGRRQEAGGRRQGAGGRGQEAGGGSFLSFQHLCLFVNPNSAPQLSTRGS